MPSSDRTWRRYCAPGLITSPELLSLIISSLLTEYEVNLMEAAAPILRTDIDLGKTYVRNFIRKNECNDNPISPITCYFSSEDLFTNRKLEIIKRQERQFGTCIDEDNMNPHFLDSILKQRELNKKRDELMKEERKEDEDDTPVIFTYQPKFQEKSLPKKVQESLPSEHFKNPAETEKKDSQSKWLRPKKNKNNKCREEEEEELDILAASRCEKFPLFLSSRISVPVPFVYDSMEYYEPKNPPLNGFSVAIYFLCFIVMYIFMSFKYF